MPDAKSILTRIVLGAVLIAAVAGLLVLDHRLVIQLGDKQGFVLTGLVIVLGIMGFLELGRLTAAAGTKLLPVSGILGVVVVGTAPFWCQVTPYLFFDDLWALLGFVVALAFLEQMLRHRTDDAARRIGATLLGVLYLGAGSAVILAIRMNAFWGVPVVVVFLAAVKCTDIGAYFTGILLGRHKLIAWLSPGKTWEGLLGGLAFGAGAAVLSAWLLGIDLPPVRAAIFGAAVGAAGQFADLCESLLKRSAAVKDSSALLPAFGGVLDVLDSPLLSAPVAYVLLSVMA